MEERKQIKTKPITYWLSVHTRLNSLLFVGSNVVFKATTCKACNRYATEWCLFAWLMHDATCKLVAFTEVRVAIKSTSNFQRHPDPNYSYFCILLLILKSAPGRPLALLFALIFRAALVVSWLLVVTPILEGKTAHQPEKAWIKSEGNPSEMGNLTNTYITTLQAVALACPVQSLSSALPPSSRRTTSRRSCCSTSRFGHSSRHFEGVHQRNCCARDR